MNNVHDTFQRIFDTHPSVPKMTNRTAINDDDGYVIDIARRTIVGHYSSGSATAQIARAQGLPLHAGLAHLRGLQLKCSGLVDMEAV